MDDGRNASAYAEMASEAWHRVKELEAALREARYWLEHWGGDSGSLGGVLQKIDDVLNREWD